MIVALAFATPPLPTLTLAQQETDLATLWQALNERHPGLTLYADEATLDAAVATARAGFTPDATAFDLWADLSLVVASVGCTHTVLRVLERLRDALGPTVFPLDLVVVDDTLYVDPRVHPGPAREVVSVQGTPSRELLTALRARASSDGRSNAHQDVMIDEHAWLLITATLGPQETWTIETQTPASAVEVASLPGLHWSKVPEYRPRRRPAIEPVDRVVVIPVTSFADSDASSRRVVASMRRRACGADALVLDLRGNGGGRTDSLLELWSLFAERPMTPYVVGWTKRADHGWPTAPPGSLPLGAPTNAYHAEPDDLYPPVQPLPDAVDVPVVVVVDGSTVSSGSDLAYFFQAEGRATVVGSETASGRWLQNCEQYQTVPLPSSHLLLRVPLIALATADTAGRGQGVIPDVVVQPTIDDLASGRDPALERAIALAQELARDARP